MTLIVEKTEEDSGQGQHSQAAGVPEPVQCALSGNDQRKAYTHLFG